MVAIKKKHQEKGIRIDRQRMELYLDGKELKVCPMELKVADVLLLADGMVCTPTYIAEQASMCETFTAVAQQISRLRHHLGKRIETVGGHGYKIRREHHA